MHRHRARLSSRALCFGLELTGSPGVINYVRFRSEAIMSACNKTSTMLFVAATAAILTVALPVEAQIPTPNPVEQTHDSVKLNMEQRHIIKEIILKELKTAPQAANAPTTVGATVPAGIALQPIPVEVSAKIPQLKTHSFLVKDDKVIIVDPKDNKVSALVE